MNVPRARQFKICLIGDGYVGKTSIRLKYLKGAFKKHYIPTLGVDFAQKAVDYKDIHTNLIIWDIAGQSLFQSLRKRYYDGASGIILVYSVVDRVSFDNAMEWLEEAKRFVGNLPPLVIIGNKIDIRSSAKGDEIVSTAEGREFAETMSKRLGANVVFIETSALTGENIDTAFETLVGLMISHEDRRKMLRQQAGASATMQSTSEEFIDLTSAKPQFIAEESMLIRSEPIKNESETPVITESSTPQEIKSNEESLAGQKPSFIGVTDEELIKDDMKRIFELREKLKKAEDELEEAMGKYEGQMVELKNLVEAKKMMYVHTQETLRTLREEWATAYKQYTDLEKAKAEETDKKMKEIDELKMQIEQLGKAMKERVEQVKKSNSL